MSSQYKENKMNHSPFGKPGSGGRHGVMGMVTPVEKAKDFKGTLKKLAIYLKSRKLQLLAVFAAVVLSTIFSIVSPKIMGKAVTKLFEGIMMKFHGVPNAKVDFEYIGNTLLILAGLYLISAAFSYIQQYIMASVAQKTVYEMRKDVIGKLSRLPLEFFDSRTHGEILSRVTNDIDNIANTLQQSLTQLFTAIITIIGIIIMMLSISPFMTLIALITIPLSAAITVAIASRSQKYFSMQQKEIGLLNGHVEEMLGGHKIIKAFGREKESINQFDEINKRLYDAGWKAQFISGTIMPLMSFVTNIGYVLVCIVGGIFVIHGKTSIGDVQAFIQYSRQISHPILQTANITNILQSTVASAERVFELLEEKEATDAIDAETIANPKGNVRFENVGFSYKENTPVITNININVSHGQTVAIVGPTGAGKTTLVNLLMRFYETDCGKITIDGTDIRSIKKEKLRSLFGMVLQDAWLFNGTVKENIAYGCEGASEEDIIRAAETAQADHFIRTLPEGYDTVLNEETSNISQGQKQLLTIARAVLADPAILILDEATSSVDTRTEALIQKAMMTLMKGRTSFVIAHRLSTIRNADIILVMNRGSIVETGNHKELLEKGGFYADLYKSQFAGINIDRAI